MAELESQLDLDRCPHCNVDKPSLAARHSFATKDYRGGNERVWIVYSCNRCGGAITAGSFRIGARIKECYPAPTEVSESIPGTAREYLVQAIQSLSAPAGAVMLAASSIDAMLKGRGYKSGSLYERIKNAATDHVITDDMAQWAHDVRLDANDHRHADESAALPTSDDAIRCVDFALALGEFLFVLPARVRRGLAETKKAI